MDGGKNKCAMHQGSGGRNRFLRTCTDAPSTPVLPFQRKYRLAHPENYLFSLLDFVPPKYPNKYFIIFLKRKHSSTLANAEQRLQEQAIHFQRSFTSIACCFLFLEQVDQPKHGARDDFLGTFWSCEHGFK